MASTVSPTTAVVVFPSSLSLSLSLPIACYLIAIVHVYGFDYSICRSASITNASAPFAVSLVLSSLPYLDSERFTATIDCEADHVHV